MTPYERQNDDRVPDVPAGWTVRGSGSPDRREDELVTAVTCTGCGATVAGGDEPGLGGLLTDHDRECDTHSMTRCTHPGKCYEDRPTSHGNGSKDA